MNPNVYRFGCLGFVLLLIVGFVWLAGKLERYKEHLQLSFALQDTQSYFIKVYCSRHRVPVDYSAFGSVMGSGAELSTRYPKGIASGYSFRSEVVEHGRVRLLVKPVLSANGEEAMSEFSLDCPSSPK